MNSADHTFVVPAYGESPYLNDCLASLSAQSRPTRIVIATSTPCAAIDEAALHFGVPVFVNHDGGGIGKDWNFALSCANTPWATIAHQDDLYLPDFAARSLEAAQSYPDTTMVFTGYTELVGDIARASTTLLRIKRLLLELGFVGGASARSRFFKTNVLRFGCAIPCPSVTLHLGKSQLRFREDLKVDLDWAAWLQLARSAGTFVYIRDALMQHRVHDESETSAGIAGGTRASEDRAVLRLMWPAAIADAIAATYGVAYRSNHA